MSEICIPALPTTPDVPRGTWWNHNGAAMVGYWELLDAYEELRREIDWLKEHALPS